MEDIRTIENIYKSEKKKRLEWKRKNGKEESSVSRSYLDVGLKKTLENNYRKCKLRESNPSLKA